MAAIPKGEWEWYGFAGHFICGHRCYFRMTTKVGKYLVSTVGAMPKRDGESGFEEIGMNRTFETMVFYAGAPCQLKDCDCGQPEADGDEQGFRAYDSGGAARRGHLEMCERFASAEMQDKAREVEPKEDA